MRRQSWPYVVATALTLALLLPAGVSTGSPSGPAVTGAAGCGTAIRKASGTLWRCTFADNFAGSTLNRAKWSVQTTATSGYHSGAECFVDRPTNIKVAKGVLQLTVRKERGVFKCEAASKRSYWTRYTSGMVSTHGKYTQAYGRFEVRARFPGSRTAGVQSSIWMWPEKQTRSWPTSGELDIAEWYSVRPNRVYPFVHYGDDDRDPNRTRACVINDVQNWHRYRMVWTTRSIAFYYDGKLCTRTSAWVPAPGKWTPFSGRFMVALTQMLGITSNLPTSATVLPASMQVDYVRMWS